MNEISPEESEAIIDASADGVAVGAHAPVAELLTSLHAPAEALGSAPAISMASRNVTGRIARRTAVAASIAVLGLASVAAAATGTIDLLDPLLGDDGPTLADVADDEEEEEVPASTTTVEEEDGDEAVEDGDDTEHAGQRAEIDGVDPSDGLNDEELELLCDAAEDHGHYVSSVAKDTETETDGTHGDRVSEEAHSDCGKDIDDESDDESDDDESDDDESDDDESDDDESDDDESDDDDDDDESDGPGNGRGRGHENGNGHGNGNGQRDD